MTYVPRPIDTSEIVLPEVLQPLLDQLAENTHDVWAAQRIRDGWTYGPVRDDAARHHPCLVPYSELPDSEKEYDRKTAAEALKVVLKLGCRIMR